MTSIAPTTGMPAQTAADSGVKLLECVRLTAGELGYTPRRLDNPAGGRFRHIDAQGNDAEWYVAEIALGRTVLIAEAWVDSSGGPALFVTAYQSSNGSRISGVEPGREKNRRLGAFFQSSVKDLPGTLTADVTKDLVEIRAACPSPAT